MMANRNFVNLSVNPCKMCMPMGVVTAFKGIENSMILLHGSQGCSTYIRRHMAGHYNEPVDIASSSLNEEGTVFGGERNLKNGLKNVIKLYNPDIIGVSTTCLAETIGEDIGRMVSEFISEEGLDKNRIISLSSPGYGGSQFEGYFKALTEVTGKLVKNSMPNGRINVIVPFLNPGEIRCIKHILDMFGLEYILFPDISDTLDSPFSESYKKIPEGGTKIDDIKTMSGSAATIEMALTVPKGISPGQYLWEKYGMPLYRCAIPIGIEYTDRFINIVSEASGKPVPSGLLRERGRFIDGMIDSHKYNAEGRTVIYGEPEHVLSLSRFCCENGVKPLLVCTGTQNGIMKTLLEEMTLEDKPLVLDDIDFETIQQYAKEMDANILIGNSDGKVITEKEGIPLVRFGFPIHDRVGGQRSDFIGYTGSMKLLDKITNTLLERKYEEYRSGMYLKYYKKEEKAVSKIIHENRTKNFKAAESTKTHPCYSSDAHEYARMHIPVAPACNISCNYCSRKYDCVNESRPGVTSKILTPVEALDKFLKVKEKFAKLSVVGIAGPGDALANFEKTEKSIELIKNADPDITFCLSTNGLMLPYYADEIIRLGVSHVTVTINAVDADIGVKIYREVNFKGLKLKGREAVELLMGNQLAGLTYLVARGVICKVNIVMIQGVNHFHIEEVVKKVKECGAFMTNIMPLIPVKGTVFENHPLVSNKELNEMRRKCSAQIKQMYHCQQCRADAIGTIGNDCSFEFDNRGCSGCIKEDDAGESSCYTFAVATGNGLYVDRHFGHVNEFYIYRCSKASKIEFVEKRQVSKYCSGTSDCEEEESKMERVLESVKDCDAVLVMRIGYRPQQALEKMGISVVQTCGKIEEAIGVALKHLSTAKDLIENVV